MYILSMTIPTIDTKKIQSYIDKRLNIINSAIGTLTLGENNADLVLSAFSSYLMSFLSVSSTNDASFFNTKFSEVFTKMIQPIPENELASTGITKLMHNKFTTLAQAILAHPKAHQFFHAAIKDGCHIMVKGLTDFKGDLQNLEDSFIQHLTELQPYINMLQTNPALAFSTIVGNNQAQITDMSKNLYLKLFELQASMSKYGNFASAKADEVYGIAHDLNSLLTGLAGMKNIPTSIGDLTNKLTSAGDIWAAGTALFSKIDNMVNIESKIASTIDFNSLFNSNLSKILSTGRRIKDYCANLSSLVDQNVNAVTTAAQEVTAMLPFIQGLMKSMAQKNLLQGLGTGANKNMFDTMASGLTALTKPIDELNSLKRDVDAVFAVSKNLINGVVPHSTAIPTLITRMQSNFNTVKAYADAAMSLFNAYAPVIEDTAMAAFNALKATAPTPLKALSTGDVNSFQKALINPLALTQIGPIMEEISTYLGQSEELTIEEVTIANELLDYINREHTREAITTYLSDEDLQKSVAIAGLKKFVDTDLKYPQNLVKMMEVADKASHRIY